MAINRQRIKQLLENHSFKDIFIEELGWDDYSKAYPLDIGEKIYALVPIANKRGFIALHCPVLPNSATRAKIETKVSRDIREHLIIFTDETSKKQRWQWVRRIPGQPLSRKEHEYLPNQPLLLIEKIGYLEVSVDEEENIDLIDVFDKVKNAFDVDKVTKKFYDQFKKEHDGFLDFIEGISSMGDAKWYASVMLNRLMFIYFIQKKGFLDGDSDYLRNRLKAVQQQKGKGKFQTFYHYFLLTLCHEVLGKKVRKLDKDLVKLIGNVPYLNGGIFQPHELEIKYGETIAIDDDAFETIFNFFDQYEWHLDSRPNADEDEINPDVLGYIFEKYINQKQMGAYYTKEDITEYISKNTILPCLFDKAQKSCKIAFEGKTAVWNLLKADPDRYIYHAVRHGVTYDIHNDCELTSPVEYPEEIAIGLDAKNPKLLKRRKKWNNPTSPAAGLPTEIWRETVARRQRYEEVREKLANGEIYSINDLITYNLDIRQFVQDVIEQCESPDLLNAFWVAIAGRMPDKSNQEIKPGVTVLDPTCGSGAFLFAALNILEPLYEACLDRMEGFLEEWGDKPKHRNYAAFFSLIRAEIGNHPSSKYFIYKSIIINNLYGVDMMKEAVEICKLRLFLKLVAQVGETQKIEPLPDIDFNIRSGNTLVGFATEKQMQEFFDRDNDGQALLQFDTRLDAVNSSAEEIESCFNLFRKAQLENDESLPKAKKVLAAKLDKLNDKLHQYLADDYGINRKKKNAYENFLESHQPFHWFVEFYGIIRTGGFDAIIGNPPYVEYSKVRKKYKLNRQNTLSCGNLYAFILERTWLLCSVQGYNGMIVQNSSVSTNRMKPLQDLMCSNYDCFVSNYDDRPAKLFTGIHHMKGSILLCVPRKSATIHSSAFMRWYEEYRPFLFGTIQYVKLDSIDYSGHIQKIGNNIQSSVLSKIQKQSALRNVITKGAYIVYCHRIASYFIKAIDFIPYFWNETDGQKKSDDYKIYQVNTLDQQSSLLCILNSSYFYYYWHIYQDGYHCGKACIEQYPFSMKLPKSIISRIHELSSRLSKSYENTSFRKETNYKATGRVVYDEFYPKKSKAIIDEIDKVLANHYEFTEEELDYIINYDIKYRMGKDLTEGK